jgi:hypothetical protein
MQTLVYIILQFVVPTQLFMTATASIPPIKRSVQLLLGAVHGEGFSRLNLQALGFPFG